MLPLSRVTSSLCCGAGCQGLGRSINYFDISGPIRTQARRYAAGDPIHAAFAEWCARSFPFYANPGCPSMTMSAAAFSERVLGALERATAAALDAGGPEEALRAITLECRELLGDKDAQYRPGALKPGEHQFSAAGAFFVTADRAYNLLLAEVNFPPEQHRLKIDVTHGHPGWVVKNERPLLLANTDDHVEFKQILKTARMGSAIFAPMIWRGRLLGQLVTASQARHTYAEPDLRALVTFAQVATPLWIAHGGPRLVEQLSRT